jgi:hypothetical protein
MIVAIVIIAICWKRHKQGPDAIKKNTRLTVTVLLPEVSHLKLFYIFNHVMLSYMYVTFLIFHAKKENHMMLKRVFTSKSSKIRNLHFQKIQCRKHKSVVLALKSLAFL